MTFLKAVPVVFLGSHLALALAPPTSFPVEKISLLFCTGTASFDGKYMADKKGFQKLETV